MTASGQTRSFGDVGSMSGLPESGYGLSDLRVRALISATAPPFAVGRSPASESEPLAASRRSPIPATVSIAVAGVSPRRGRSSALDRSISINLKKEGPGGGSLLGTSQQVACAPAVVRAILQRLSEDSRRNPRTWPRTGVARPRIGVGGVRGRFAGGRPSFPGGRAPDGRGRTSRGGRAAAAGGARGGVFRPPRSSGSLGPQPGRAASIRLDRSGRGGDPAGCPGPG